MKKHILPLTYEPKIQAVIEGTCTQTIRPMNWSNQKKPGDLIMFHGWEGKPYRSKWSFRTPYWKLIEVIDVLIFPDRIVWHDENCNVGEFKGATIQDIARMDGFRDYSSMYQELKRMYGVNLDDMYFQILRWYRMKGLIVDESGTSEY